MLSPAAAAKRAGCGRTSIMRALESKSLKGNRDNRNRWRIDPVDLDAWSRSRPDTVRTCADNVPDTVQDTSIKPSDHMQALASLAAAEARVEELRSNIEKNEERHLAEITRLERIIEQITQPRPSLLERISGAIRYSRGA